MTTSTSTSATYDRDLATATAELTSQLERDGYEFDAEFAKSAQDALNNAWYDGVAIDAWVAEARTLLTGHA